MVYFLLILWIYGMWFLSRLPQKWNSDRRRLLFFGGCFLALFLICGLRDESVSWDMTNYLLKYEAIKDCSFGEILSQPYTQRIEFGFALINKLLGLIFADPHAIIIFTALATTALWFGFFWFNIPKEQALSAMILYACCGLYLHQFGFARQMLAAALLMNAWALLTRKRYGLSALLFLLAVTQHFTALCFLVVYLFYFLRNRRIAFLLLAGAGLLALVHIGPLLRLAALVTDQFPYLGKSDVTLSLGGIYLAWAAIAAVILWMLSQYLFPKRLPKGLRLGGCDGIENACLPLFSALYIALTFLGAFYNYLDRFGLFFLPFVLLLLPCFGAKLKARYPRLSPIYEAGVQLGFIGLFLLTVSAEHYQYSFFFQY